MLEDAQQAIDDEIPDPKSDHGPQRCTDLARGHFRVRQVLDVTRHDDEEDRDAAMRVALGGLLADGRGRGFARAEMHITVHTSSSEAASSLSSSSTAVVTDLRVLKIASPHHPWGSNVHWWPVDRASGRLSVQIGPHAHRIARLTDGLIVPQTSLSHACHNNTNKDDVKPNGILQFTESCDALCDKRSVWRTVALVDERLALAEAVTGPEHGLLRWVQLDAITWAVQHASRAFRLLVSSSDNDDVGGATTTVATTTDANMVFVARGGPHDLWLWTREDIERMF